VDPDRGELVFAGAHIPLLLADTGGLREIRGDRQSIGYRSSDPDYPYTNHCVPLAPGLACYMATDGLIGQAGGDKGLPFGRTRLASFLSSRNGRSMAEHKEELLRLFRQWRGAEEQRDDVTVVGFTF
jgi:serine phosphatase RsbU (regulator of sigma subunit)